MKLYKRFYKIISRNYELRKFWSVDYSSCFDFRYFPSHSTTPRIKLSCKSVNWQYAVISGPAVRNWNARFFSTKKLKGKRKRPKKWNYTLINLCHPVKCIHRLRCLHFEESVRSWLQSAGFDNTEWIKHSNKYLPQQFFKRQIIFKAREYLIKKIP